MYVGWTDERIDKLKSLWAEGRSAAECAALIGGGFSRSAVIGKVHRLGLASRKVAKRARPGTGRRRESMGSFDSLKMSNGRPSKFENRVLGKPIAKRSQSIVRELLRDLPTEPLPPVDTMIAQVSFNDLEAHHCRAITVDHLPFNADRKIYCGERRVLGTSYCECHLRRYATPVFVKKTHPDRPAWQDNRTGSKGAVFLSGREKMKAY